MKELKFEIYKDKQKQWRWRLKAKNGKIIADSGECYKRERSVIKAIESIAHSDTVFSIVWK